MSVTEALGVEITLEIEPKNGTRLDVNWVGAENSFCYFVILSFLCLWTNHRGFILLYPIPEVKVDRGSTKVYWLLDERYVLTLYLFLDLWSKVASLTPFHYRAYSEYTNCCRSSIHEVDPSNQKPKGFMCQYEKGYRWAISANKVGLSNSTLNSDRHRSTLVWGAYLICETFIHLFPFIFQLCLGSRGRGHARRKEILKINLHTFQLEFGNWITFLTCWLADQPTIMVVSERKRSMYIDVSDFWSEISFISRKFMKWFPSSPGNGISLNRFWQSSLSSLVSSINGSFPLNQGWSSKASRIRREVMQFSLK